MSCRVIGRNVEYAMLAHIIDALRARGVRRLTAEYLRTPKNSVAQDFYLKAGFERRNESIFEIELNIP